MENVPEIPVNLPKVDIVVGQDVSASDSVKEAPAGVITVIPAVPIHATKDNGEVDPPSTQQVVSQIRDLTNKSVLIALKKLTEMLPNLEEKDIEKFVNMTLKLLDAQMAFDWSDRFAKTILKNPALLKSIKGGSGRTGIATGNMAKMKKLNEGDGRTTPKKFKNEMPQDDEEVG